MTHPPIEVVPFDQRWRWAKLQAKADAEGGTPPEQWLTPELPAPFHLALAYWIYMLRWPPLTNGHGVIVTARTRFGRTATLAILFIGIGIVVGLFRRWPWIGVVIGVAMLPLAIGSMAYIISTWRAPPHVTYVANFLRHPTASKGSALPVLRAVCDEADARGHTLALHTRRARLVALYESYGFSVVAGPNSKNRVRMTRRPNPPR